MLLSDPSGNSRQKIVEKRAVRSGFIIQACLLKKSDRIQGVKGQGSVSSATVPATGQVALRPAINYSATSATAQPASLSG